MPAKAKTCLTLFTSALVISAVTFGSGYVIVSVIKKRFVDELKWIDEEEMVDLIALAQSSPGVVTANTALLVGYKVCGVIGALAAVAGVALPPLFTVSLISVFYGALRENAVVSAVLKGMQAGACAVIGDVVCGLFVKEVRGRQAVLKAAIMVGAFIATYVFKVPVILTILICVLFGVVWHFAGKGRRERHGSE